ncbi:hypothetical protein HG536_0F03350 [Torulaspora globosa]|uniref:Uncharacterized protein n=1 Tax=Torulaspora globosa TaxID=48254 RepID=A0A7G3ZKH4_9SACH|nr:uncharacterized protein HG536_0F03350 [Torulaspora globosa]QLL34010.1 hypothetical protein HG536_0F03350 [Torulaspora globosa]
MQPALHSIKVQKSGFESEDDLELSTGRTAFSMRLSTGVPRDSCSSSESLRNSVSTQVRSKRRFRRGIKLYFQSFRKKSGTAPKSSSSDTEAYYLTSDDDRYSVDSLEAHGILPKTDSQLSPSYSNDSSIRTRRFKFWSNSTEGDNRTFDEERKVESSRSAVSDTIVFQRPPRHKVRFWLNEKRHGHSDSILEIRQSAITTRIARSRCLAGIAAVEAARLGEYRRKIRALKFAVAATTAAFARVNKAKQDINASHGSIANAAMYSSKAIAAASIISPQANQDYKKIQRVFNEHFKHKDDPTYFRRLKYIPMQQLDRNSAAYKMHLKLRAIPTPSCKDDIYKFHSTRLDRISTSQHSRASTLQLSIA